MQNSLFLLARHGETPLNKSHAHVGHSDIGLDDDGQKQAEEAAQFLSHWPNEIRHVISSPRTRTQETAAIICATLGIDEYLVDDRLTDLDVGDFTGQNEFEHSIEEYLKDTSKKFPNGESMDDFELRQNDFAQDLVRWIESGQMEAGAIVVVTHSPVIIYWHSLQHPNEKIELNRSLLRPGGIAEVTDDGVFPLFRKAKTAEEKQDDKIDPAVMLYMPPEALGDGGAKCGICVLGLSDGRCVSVHADDDKTNTDVSLEHGVCGIYVHGALDSLVQIQPIISRTEAGYINKGAPTNCGKCEYFTYNQEFGCLKVDGRKTAKGKIESGGCCNRWEPK